MKTLNNLQSSTVINKYEKIFSQFGTPKELVFSSHYFQSFSRTWDFEQWTISPHFHQSNGLAERSIQTIKRTLKSKINKWRPLSVNTIFEFPTWQ